MDIITLPYLPYSKKLFEYFFDNIMTKRECEEYQKYKSKSSFDDLAHHHYGLSGKFEDWLFSEGVRIICKDKKRYLTFSSDEDATIFLLRWGV